MLRGLGRSVWARVVLVLATASLLGAAVAVAESTSTSRNSRETPDPTIAPERQRDDDGARQRAHRSSEAGRREREQSRSAFRNQSDREALATGRDKFGAFLDAPPLRWPALGSGEAVSGFVNDHVAVVREGSGRRGIVESDLPVVGETPSGDHATIDLSLIDADPSSYAPRSAATSVRIPKDASGELRFPDQSFGVALDGARDDAAAVTSNKAFYANALTDGDLVLEPRPTGAEVSVVLRSPATPTTVPLRFDLAHNQRLELTSDSSSDAGSAEVLEGDRRVAAIGPATAVDAQGATVPVSYAVDRNRLLMRVDTDRELAYPILVDPPIGVYDNNGTSVGSDEPDGWKWKNWTQVVSVNSQQPTTWAACNAGQSVMFYFCQGTLNGGLQTGGAIFVKAHPSVDYQPPQFGEWVKNARADSYIYQLDATAISHAAARSELLMGVWSTASGFWESGSWTAPGGSPSSCCYAYELESGGLSSVTRYFRVRNGQPGDDIPTGNIAAFALVMTGGVPVNTPYIAVGGAATFSSEKFVPTLDAPSHSVAPPAGWVDNYSDNVSTTARDRGLGMGTITATGPGLSGSQSACVQNDAPPNTSGANAHNYYDSCVLNLALPAKAYTAPEGINTYRIAATDLVGNHDAAQDETWQAKVDRTGPSVTLSGTLWNQRGQTLASGQYNLHAYAADGTASATPANARSGLSKIEVSVDGDVEQSFSPATCGTNGCDGAADYVFDTEDWPAEPHTIAVVATDRMGHTTTQTFQVTVPGEPGDVPEEDTAVLLPSEAVPDDPTAVQQPSAVLPDPTGYATEKDAALTDPMSEDAIDQVPDSSPVTDLTPPVSPARTVLGNANQSGLGPNGFSPSDSTGAIGPQRYIEMVNERVGMYDRNLVQQSTMTLPAFVGAPNSSVFDPQIMWDSETQRWYYLADRKTESPPDSGNFIDYLAFGWSKTANPADLSAGNWCRFFNKTAPNFDDYPKLGDDRRHLIFGTNVYQNDERENPTAHIWAVPKPLAGDTSCARPKMYKWGTVSNPLRTRDGSKVFAPVPAQTRSSSNVGFVAAADYPSTGYSGSTSPHQLQTWHVSGARTKPRLTRDANVDVAQYKIPANVRQQGSDRVIDTQDTRLQQAVAMNDPAVGRIAYWTQQTIRAPGGRSRVRWYELVPRASTPRRQQGTVSDSSNSVFNAAISPTANGGAVMHYNVAGPTLRPQIRARSRLRTTGLHRLSGEITVATSANAPDDDFTCYDDMPVKDSPECRWGDYSGATPDPSSGDGVWGTNTLLGLPQLFNDPNWTTRNFQLSAVP